MRILSFLFSFAMLAAPRAVCQDSITLSGTQPFVFTSLGSGTYSKSAIYNRPTDGFLIDLAKVSDSIDSDPIDFNIDARGGGHYFFTIKGASGNVGIGTATPQSRLHLQGTGSELTLRADAINQPFSNAIVFDEGDGGRHFQITYDGSAKANGSNGRLVFSNAGQTDLLTIERNGLVGIGTSDPQYPLSVNGTIQAKEVIVETGWSDFVFEDGYALRSLSEVESHIEEYGHLPDIPSATEVESEGLSVGEAQKLMMQKIEELTLYVIDLKKESDEQQALILKQQELLDGIAKTVE